MPSVVLVTSSFLPRVGGVEEHVLHLATRLRDRGYDVAVWAVDRGDTPATVPGVTVRYLPTPMPARSLRSLASFGWRSVPALRAWQRAWRNDRPDIVHVQCFGPNGPWATLLAALHRTPLVVGTHGETFMDQDGVFEQSALLAGSLRTALRRARAVTACSEYAAADLERFGFSGHADVVRNGVDLDDPESRDSAARIPSSPYFLGLGRLVRVKGFDLLLRAFARADLPHDIRLVIGGDGPERSSLEALARDIGVADRVEFAGLLDRAGVAETLGQALALVVPSRVEAFGIVVLEGLAAQRPVIVTSVGGAAEIVRNDIDALVVDPNDLDLLAGCLERLALEPGLRHRLGASGKEIADRQTWVHVTDLVEQVYSTVLPDRAGRS